MLKLITSESQISRCQSQLEKALESALPNKRRYTIGYHSGSMESPVRFNSKIWFSHTIVHSEDQRHWNAFGLSKDLATTKSNSIVVEINILHNGVNGRVAGAFAKDNKTGAVYLTHSGKIGGGKKGIGKNSFLKWYKKSTKNILNDKSKDVQAIVIGDISSATFSQNLNNFINNVKKYKSFVSEGEINEATVLTDKELEAKALATSSKRKSKKTKSSTTVYERNQYIVELAKRRAKGKCQLCQQKAPFKNKSGQPYLECHHIEWLSKGGLDSVENTVALCPNCHKKMHVLNLSTDINKLKHAKP